VGGSTRNHGGSGFYRFQQGPKKVHCVTRVVDESINFVISIGSTWNSDIVVLWFRMPRGNGQFTNCRLPSL
jgi:hypothetical protein